MIPSPRDRLIAFQTKTVRGVAARAFATNLLGALSDWRPDVIVRGLMEFGGYLAGELLGIPHAVAGIDWFFPDDLSRHYDGALNALREEHGLVSFADPLASYPYLALAAMPRSWVTDDEWVPSTARFIRPIPFNEWSEQPLPSWFDDLPDRPIVHASLGTTDSFNSDAGAYRAIIEALGDAPVNVLVGTGRFVSSDDLGPLPDNTRVESFYPHNLLLPHCAVFITHAGYGSSMAALTVGVPTVAVPVGADQPRNAKRMADLGIGVAPAPAERTPTRIRDAVLEVLADPHYRLNMGKLRDETLGLPDVAYGVELIERLARERQPIAGA